MFVCKRKHCPSVPAERRGTYILASKEAKKKMMVESGQAGTWVIVYFSVESIHVEGLLKLKRSDLSGSMSTDLKQMLGEVR